MAQVRALSQAPIFIRLSDPLVRRLLRFGVPLGPNTVVVMRGRLTGQQREVPLAILESAGRRYLAGTFGETNWVRNLRAGPEAELKVNGRLQPVRAVELSRADALAFFGQTMPGYLTAMPFLGRLFGALFLRIAAPEMLTDPALAAAHHPVFELLPR